MKNINYKKELGERIFLRSNGQTVKISDYIDLILEEQREEITIKTLKNLAKELELNDGEEMIETEMIRDYITDTISELKSQHKTGERVGE